MNISSKLKTLPILGSLALALISAPAIAVADNGKREQNRSHYSQKADKPHHRGESRRQHRQPDVHRGQHRNGHNRRGYNDYAHNHGHKYAFNKGHKKHHKKHHKHGHYGHHRHPHYRHGHGHAYGHNYRNHYQSQVIVRPERRAFVDLRDLRFMFGLHTDNLDLIFRD
ncbi:MAG: hypothetical protein KJO91_00680 [Gammaproteobacteria bacterium]|nr:hypothetical protein [Gammaproteobacteria bacterium]